MRATLAAGCFWHVEALFRKTDGVKSTKVGYIGGSISDPTYEDVCTDRTGHAEAVQIEYEPDKISFEEILDIFWDNHNPTTLNRQGFDVGTQYRSAIFYHDKEQQKIAEDKMRSLSSSGAYDKPIVTQIVPAPTFYPAEEYHQRYYEKMNVK